MTTQKHTKEPWNLPLLPNDIILHGVKGISIEYNDGEGHLGWFNGSNDTEEEESNLRRMIFCVNALAGIENPEEFVAAAKEIFALMPMTINLIHESGRSETATMLENRLTDLSLKAKDARGGEWNNS